MSGRFPLLPAAALTLLVVASVGSLAALAGLARPSLSPLHAQVRIEPFILPQGFGMDPVVVSDFLQQQLRTRAEGDVAIRMALGVENSAKLRDVVLPRLVNAGVIRTMIERVQPLRTVLAVSQFRSVANVVVSNTGATALTDVAIVLPQAIQAERSDGSEVEVVARSDDAPTALRLGTIAPGEEISLTAWLAAPIGTAGDILVGAAEGVNGSVAIFGRQHWFGADLETLGWARWTIGTILALAALGAAAALTLLGVSAFRRQGPASRA